MFGNFVDCGIYEIGVLCEDEGCGGLKFLYCIFIEGCCVFVSKLINYFELDEIVIKIFFMGGGIGIMLMIVFVY